MPTTNTAQNPESLLNMMSHAFEQVYSAPWWIWAVILFVIILFVVRKGTNRVRAF